MWAWCCSLNARPISTGCRLFPLCAPGVNKDGTFRSGTVRAVMVCSRPPGGMACSWPAGHRGRRERSRMPGKDREVVVGLDNGGTAINATVLDCDGRFLVDRLVETPSRVGEGPAIAIEALDDAFIGVLSLTGVPRDAVQAVGLDTPGPASADGVISTRGAVNFADPSWRGFDVRGALEA